MYERFTAVKTGIVVILASLALLGLLYFATGGTWFREWSYYRLRVEPGRLAPRAGDSIWVNGVDSGRVESIKFGTAPRDESEWKVPGQKEWATYVFIRARIDQERKLPRKTKGMISESLTGLRSLQLELADIDDPNDPNAYLTEADTHETPIEIRQAPDMTSVVTRFEEVGTQAKSLVTKVQTVADNANVFLTSARETMEAVKTRVETGDIDTTLKNVAEASENIKQITAEVDARIGPITEDLQAAAADIRKLAKAGAELGDKLGERVDGVVEDLKGVVARVDGILARAEPKIDGFFDDVGAVGKNVLGLSEDLAAAGPEIREVLRAAGRDVDELMEILKDTGYNLADASEDIRAHPWKLLNEPEADEIAYENLRTTMQNYVRAMHRVDRAAETVRQAMTLDPKDAGTSGLLQRALSSLDSSLDSYRSVEARLMEMLSANRPQPPARVR